MVSSSSSHIRHLLEAGIPLLLRFAKTGRLSCRVFQMKVRIFKGSLTFQISKHQRDSDFSYLCGSHVGGLENRLYQLYILLSQGASIGAYLHCHQSWRLEFVRNITQSNNARTRLTQKTNRKQITWRHYIVFLRQYLPPTLLWLKGYRKFVFKIQPRCWVLQITILVNDHGISCASCVSLQFLIL